MNRRTTLIVASTLILSEAVGGQELHSYRLRGVWGLPTQAKIELARVGMPIWYTPSSPQNTLADALRSVCGDQGTKANAYLTAETMRLNYAKSLDERLELGESVAIPFCLRIDDNVPVKVAAGDTIEELLKEKYGIYGRRTIQETFELNRGQHASLESFAATIRPDQTIVLPHVAEERVLSETGLAIETKVKGGSRSFLEIVESLEPGIRAALVTNVVPVDPPPPDDHEYQYVRFVSAVESAAGCVLPPGETGLPTLDPEILRDRLAVEAQHLPPDADGFDTAVVGIIDTGVRAFDDQFLRESDFFPSKGEQDNEEDDDENGYVDDIYGINFNTYANSGEIQFYPTDPDRDHGTKIASLVLGGRDFRSVQPAEADAFMRLKIVNFSSSSPGRSTVSAVHLSPAIEYLGEQGVHVINMSLLNGQRIKAVPNILKSNEPGTRDVLFVVAAGNSVAGAGLDLGATKAFPARYGGRAGDYKRRVITVGAHDRTGDWAKFSHYSAEFVDLLAPGCAVEVLNIDGQFVRENGTSPATAMVSFAAGLLRALHETSPENIKNRLLASVDVDPRLERRAWTSGRLNTLKAISLSHDVIELGSSPEPYRFGRIVDRGELRRFCGDHDVRSKYLHDVVKVRPNLGPAESPRIEYWTKTDGLLSKITCPQTDTDVSIGTVRLDAQDTLGPPLRQIRDIVLASRSL